MKRLQGAARLTVSGRNSQQSGGGFTNWKTAMDLVGSIKAQAPLPSGVYVGIVTGAPQPINDLRRRGVRFVLEVVEGPARGRRATAELVTELKVGGNRARMLSDHQALAAWIDALGVTSAATPTELLRQAT